LWNRREAVLASLERLQRGLNFDARKEIGHLPPTHAEANTPHKPGSWSVGSPQNGHLRGNVKLSGTEGHGCMVHPGGPPN
jgi:hypothetical protein